MPVAFAQGWQSPYTELGGQVPRPQGLRTPSSANLLDDQQARTRAQNGALIAEQEQYYRDKARREQDLYREIREMQTEQQSEAQAKEAAFAANKQLYERSLAGLQAMLRGAFPTT